MNVRLTVVTLSSVTRELAAIAMFASVAVARPGHADELATTPHEASPHDPQEPSPNVGLFRLPAHRSGADVLAGPEGFGLLSKDNDFGLMIHWILQADGRGEVGALAKGAARDTFLVRFAGLALTARLYGRLRSELLVNFAGPTPSLAEAWVDAELAPWLHVKAGSFHVPISLERATTAIFFALVDANMASGLLPSADTGAEIWGRVGDGLVEYNLGVVNGAVAGAASPATDVDAGKDVVGRIFAQPFLTSRIAVLQHLGVGVGASDGIHRGVVGGTGLPKLTTWGGVSYYAYANSGAATGTSLASGNSARLVPQASWHEGPVSAYGEYVRGFDHVAGSRVRYDALGVVATVVVTGEDAIPLHYVVPAHSFAPAQGHWGALELAATVGGAEVKPGGAIGAVAGDAGSRAARTIGGGVNWYPVLALRVMVDAQHTWFEPLPGTTPVADETVLVARLQVVL